MPTLTVLAPDSALAMDEIARQLGEDAFILSTSQRDGMIEIKASNDPMPAMPRAVGQGRTGLGATLADLGGDEAVTVLHRARTGAPRRDPAPQPMGQGADTLQAAVSAASPRPPGTLPTVAASTQAAQPGAALDVPGANFDARAALAQAMGAPPQMPGPPAFTRPATPGLRRDPAPEPVASSEPPMRGASVHALPLPQNPSVGSPPLRLADLEDLRHDIAEIRAQIAALAKGPSATGGTASDPDPVRASILAAGFAPALVSDLAAQLPQSALSHQGFAARLARHVVAAAPEAALEATLLVLMGPSGAGRTTLAAKLAAHAAEHRPDRGCKLIEFAPAGATQPNDGLRRHARLLSYAHGYEIGCERWHEEDLDRPTPLAADTLHIVDMPAFSDMGERAGAILSALSRLGPTVRLMVLPGALGGAAIRALLARPEAAGAEIALTKLDEGEIMPPEISALAAAGGRIGWLSGTRALVGNLSPASEAIWRDYIGECLDRAETLPTGTNRG